MSYTVWDKTKIIWQT